MSANTNGIANLRWPHDKIIYEGLYRTCEQNGCDDPSTIRVTEEINGFGVWNCDPAGSKLFAWYSKWQRNEAIECGVDAAIKERIR